MLMVKSKLGCVLQVDEKDLAFFPYALGFGALLFSFRNFIRHATPTQGLAEPLQPVLLVNFLFVLHFMLPPLPILSASVLEFPGNQKQMQEYGGVKLLLVWSSITSNNLTIVVTILNLAWS